MYLRERLLGTAGICFDKPGEGSAAPGTVVATVVVEPVQGASAGTAAPVVTVEPAASGGTAVPVVVVQPAAPVKDDWRDGRIAELTAKLAKEREKNVAAGTATPVPGAGETEAQFNERVELAAQQKSAAAEWDRQCNSVAALGRTEFTAEAFNARLGKVMGAVDFQDPAESHAYHGLLEAAIETGSAHKILYTLGENPGEIRRLMGLTPTKRAVEMAQMAGKLATSVVAEPSGAPKPIVPLGSQGQHHEGIKPSDPKHGMQLPKADWFKRREAEAAAAGIQ